mgnify:CR=1 FL=1
MKDIIPWGPPSEYQAPWKASSLGDFLLERSLTLGKNLRQEAKRRAWNGMGWSTQSVNSETIAEAMSTGTS